MPYLFFKGRGLTGLAASPLIGGGAAPGFCKSMFFSISKT